MQIKYLRSIEDNYLLSTATTNRNNIRRRNLRDSRILKKIEKKIKAFTLFCI